MQTPIDFEELTIVPANEASWEDVRAVFDASDPGQCACQRYKVVGWIWRDSTQPERTAALRAQTACDRPDAPSTSGLIAYVDRAPTVGPGAAGGRAGRQTDHRAPTVGPGAADGRAPYREPAGWVAVEPRTAYPKLRTSRVPWPGRDEDKDDEGVWAVTCFVVRKGFRGRGLTYHLARAAVDFARERGARALEGYPMATQPGKVITWGELHVGARQVFDEAGFVEVSHPTPRRYVVRIDFDRP